MCAAKIVSPGKLPFYVGSGKEIESHPSFHTLSSSARKTLRLVGIFGITNGVGALGIFEEHRPSIRLKSSGGINKKPVGVDIVGLTVRRKPLRFELADETRIIPIREASMRRAVARNNRLK